MAVSYKFGEIPDSLWNEYNLKSKKPNEASGKEKRETEGPTVKPSEVEERMKSTHRRAQRARQMLEAWKGYSLVSLRDPQVKQCVRLEHAFRFV